jgi:hypothetical protein
MSACRGTTFTPPHLNSLRSVLLKSTVFWDVTPCSLVAGISVSEEHAAAVFRLIIHPAIVLRPFSIRLFALTPLANLHHFLICAHFRFNFLRLAAFCYANPLFLIGISFFIYAQFLHECYQGVKQGLGVMGTACSSETLELCTRLHGVTR